MSIELVMPSNHHLVLCHPLLLLLSVFPSIRVFSNESVLRIRWPKYWSFSISPSNEYLGLISFKIDYFHLLAVQGTLKSLLQHKIQKHQFLHERRICDISCISSSWMLYIFPSFPGKTPKIGRISPTFVGPDPHPGSGGVLESLGSLHSNQLPDNPCTCPVPTGSTEPGTHTHHQG